MVSYGQMTLYRDCSPVTAGWYDEAGDATIVQRIVELVGEAEGVDAVALPPLYDAIDGDVLEQVVGSPDCGSGAIVGFEYQDWNVFVRSDGRIRVCDGTRQCEVEPVFQGTVRP